MAFSKLTMYSQKMHRTQDMIVFYPDPVDSKKIRRHGAKVPDGEFEYPVLYLLNGGGANYMDWPLQTGIQHYAEEENTVIVTVTSNDRQCTMDYSGMTEFMGEELPKYIQYLFPVSKDREKTTIGGFSFGGYFAWRVGTLYAETFGTVASFSSPIDIITDLSIRPQEFYDLDELAKTDHNLLRLIRQKKEAGELLPRYFESFGDDTDMCFPVNKTAIAELNDILGNDNWYWIQGKGPHNLETCDGLIKYYFAWVNNGYELPSNPYEAAFKRKW